MKLNETINNTFADNGIWFYLQPYLDFINVEDAKKLDELYYNIHSGFKPITPYYENVIRNFATIESQLQFIARSVSYKFKDKWSKLYNMIIAYDYNALQDYEVYETTTPNIIRRAIENESTDITTEQNSSSEVNVNGFNSTSPVPSNSQNNGVVTRAYGDASGNVKNSEYTETGSRQKDRVGTSGFATRQKMFREELEVRKHNFFDIIMNDLDSILVLSVY